MADVPEQRQAETDHAVRAHLQENAGKKHRSRGGRLDVGIGKPRVEREERNLDRKRQKKCDEQPKLGPGGKHETPRRQRGLDLRVAEREGSGRFTMQKIEHEDSYEHQNRSNHGVQDELHGGVDTALTAPDPDQKVHRHQHHFPKDIE